MKRTQEEISKPLKYYTYKDKPISCPCGFSGVGEQGVMGDFCESWLYLDCPKCHKENIAVVLLPTDKQIEKYGSEREKNDLIKRKKFIEDFDNRILKTVDQLPDLDLEGVDTITLVWDIVPVVTEVKDDNFEDTVITYNNVEIWRQRAAYEGYISFGSFCNLAKQKYGSKLVDVVPTKRSEYYLYGDKLSSIDYVKKRRQELKD